jgi:hypothetical protein
MEPNNSHRDQTYNPGHICGILAKLAIKALACVNDQQWAISLILEFSLTLQVLEYSVVIDSKYILLCWVGS